MRTVIIVAVIFLIPILSRFIRNIYRYKKNLPFEDNFVGRLMKFIVKKK